MQMESTCWDKGVTICNKSQTPGRQMCCVAARQCVQGQHMADTSTMLTIAISHPSLLAKSSTMSASPSRRETFGSHPRAFLTCSVEDFQISNGLFTTEAVAAQPQHP